MLFWYWISNKEVTFALAANAEGVVQYAAPCAKWTLGKQIGFVRHYYRTSRSSCVKFMGRYRYVDSN